MEYFNIIIFLESEIISAQGAPNCLGKRNPLCTPSPHIGELLMPSPHIGELLMDQNMLTTLITLLFF